MGSINRSRSFFKMKVDILRPALSQDVTLRDYILTDYTIDLTDVPTYIEPIHSDIVMQGQVGGIEVARMVGFFAKGTDIQINDILRENANVYNNNTVKYWKVIGKLDYGRYDFHIRVDLDVMNTQRL